MAKLRLNERRPYGQVYGLLGVAYQQDGVYFRHDGKPVDEHGTLIEPVEVEDELLTSTRPPKGSPEEAEFLKSQMDIYGQEFTSITAARRFLAGKE